MSIQRNSQANKSNRKKYLKHAELNNRKINDFIILKPTFQPIQKKKIV